MPHETGIRPHQVHAASPRHPAGERRLGQEVVALQVFVVGQDRIDRHAGAEQFQERLHRIAEPADARLAVAHRRVDRDSRE
jgi:hypothetical protein